MSRVIIGMDPHKASATTEVVDAHGSCLAAGVRVVDTGQGRMTDATDAHSIAMVALLANAAARTRQAREDTSGRLRSPARPT